MQKHDVSIPDNPLHYSDMPSIETEHDTDHSTTDAPTMKMPVVWPGLALHGYDLGLATILAQLCNVTPVELILRTQAHYSAEGAAA